MSYYGNPMVPLMQQEDQSLRAEPVAVSPVVPAALNQGTTRGMWDSIQNDPYMQLALLNAGLTMMTPRGPGENHASKIFQGINTGVNTFTTLADRELRREKESADIEGTEARTGFTGAQTAESEARLPGVAAASDITERSADAEVEARQSAASSAASQATVDAANAATASEDAQSRSRILAGQADAAMLGGSQAAADLALTKANADLLQKRGIAIEQYGITGTSPQVVTVSRLQTQLEMGDLTEQNKEEWNARFKANLDHNLDKPMSGSEIYALMSRIGGSMTGFDPTRDQTLLNQAEGMAAFSKLNEQPRFRSDVELYLGPEHWTGAMEKLRQLQADPSIDDLAAHRAIVKQLEEDLWRAKRAQGVTP